MNLLSSLICIHDAIAENAEKSPDRLAVECGDARLDYGELDARANTLSSRLVELGAGPDELVAILVERSVHLAVAIVGVLKSGSGYLPIDPETPEERVRFMIGDSAPSILITQRRFQHTIRNAENQVRVVYLDDIVFDAEAAAPLSPFGGASPNTLAYVIYTSGSTGRPKGVEVTHEGLMRFCSHMQEELRFTAADTMLAIASASFDVAVFELLFPLYCGGRVAIMPRSAAADGIELGATIARYKPSVLLATPATWKILLDSGWHGDLSMRAVSGGEPLQPSLADPLRERTRELWNHYGPTEATIAAASYRVRGDEEKIPIGQAIAGLRLLILDAERRPVPPGTVGELYISGPGVARGYRGDPDRTADRFVPLSLESGNARAYRTGDLVRITEKGPIEFTGRVDNQVKVRGHRVEPEEIEAALLRYPGVKEAAVIMQDRGVDDKRLVAFLVTAEGSKQHAAEVRRFLAPMLFSFMIPGTFFFLEMLPKNSNGKLDRHALQLMATREPDVLVAGAMSGDPIETALTHLWRRLPGFEAIGSDESFFDYGGHSLLAVKLMKEVNDHFRVALPLSVLFEAQTVAALARVIRAGAPSRPWSPLVPIRTTGARPPLFCVHGIGGNVLNFERLGTWLDTNQPIYGLQAFGLDHGRPLSSVEEMATVYLKHIREVQPEGPYVLSGYSAGGIVAFEIARQLREANQSVALLVLFDALMYTRAGVDNRRPSVTSYLKRLGRIGSRIGLFFRMRGQERWDSLRRNWTYYWWLLGITLRTRAFLLLKRSGMRLPPPRRMQDAFALAIHEYHPQSAFDGRAVLYRAVKGDSGEDVKPGMGWETAVGDLIVEVCDADHLGMFYEPQVRSLAASLSRYLCDALDQDVSALQSEAPIAH